MREFTKSTISFSWAMSLFGAQQALSLLSPSKAAKSFEAVTEATQEEFGETLKATFRAGDNLQRGMVDLTLRLMSLESFNPGRLMKMTSDVIRQSAEAASKGARNANSSSEE